MKFLILLVVFRLAFSTETELNPSETSKNGTGIDLEDRININYNYGAANAYNGHGASQSDALSYGMNTGLLYQNGYYKPLSSKTGSQSHTYNSGLRPPLTYANSGTNSRGQYGINGHAGAGYSGGRGNAFSQSHSNKFAIPLGGAGGPVLLSNLRPLSEITRTKTFKEDLPAPDNVFNPEPKDSEGFALS